MSGDLNVIFSDDMPVASVEVVSPDLRTVARVRLGGGRSTTVPVPSEGSFLRVHLPSGRIVTLTADRGQLTRVITRESLEAAESSRFRATIATAPTAEKETAPSLDDVQQYHVKRSAYRDAAPPGDAPAGDDIALGPETRARVFSPGGEPMPGLRSTDSREGTWVLFDNPTMPPYRIEIGHSWGRLEAQLPGNTRTVYARVDPVREGGSLVVGIRFATRQPVADTILNYLVRGDLYSAESMLDWVEEAEEMLLGKVFDPYAASVGAYLLLKLRHFDRLHTWVKNLADLFPFLPDGCVIWAWQQIHQNPANEDEIRHYLLQAAQRGLPVYSEGLRLLLDGLRLLGDAPEVRTASEKLLNAAGSVVWDAPVTAGFRSVTGTTRTTPVIYDIGFMASA